MNINIDRVLSNVKVNTIKKEFTILKENYSAVNSINFLKFVRSQPIDTIFENSQYIFSELREGYKFYNRILKSFDLSLEQLQVQQNKLNDFITKCKNEKYNNKNHLISLNESIEFIKSEIQYKNSFEYLKESIIYDIHCNYLQPVLENNINDIMDEIILDINYEPELLSDYQALIQNIEKNYILVTGKNFPLILTKNTVLILSMGGIIAGTLLILVLSIPLLIVNSIIEKKLDTKYIESYKYCIRKEISRLKLSKEEDVNRKKNTDKYIDQLELAYKKLDEFKGSNIIKENTGSVTTINEDENDLTTTILTQFIDTLVFDEEEDDETEDMQIELENFNILIRNIRKLQSLKEREYLQESLINDASRKVAHAVRSTGKSISNAGTNVKKSTNNVVDAFNDTIDKYRKMQANERRNRIIEGGSQFTLMKIIKYGIAVGGIWAVSPALAAIGLLASIALDIRADDKARKKILDDLEDELKIVEAKIEDSRNDEQKEKKYQLMRIKGKLEKDIARIKYRLND